MTSKPTALAGDFAELNIGERIKSHRKARGLTLGGLASMTGISEATLSRIENDQTLINAHNLYILSKVLVIDITAFFETGSRPLRAGIRSVCRKGDGVPLQTHRYQTRVLCTDLADKRMNPATVTVTARTIDEIGGLKRHDGEEFIHVISGRMILHTEHYAPLEMDEGDSVYFDSSMGHAYLAASDEPVLLMVVATTDKPATGANQ